MRYRVLSHLIPPLTFPLALTRERQSPACLLRMHYHQHHHHSTICSHDVTTSLPSHLPLPPTPRIYLFRLPPPFDWRLCDLAAVLRVKLQRL
jgi:hypothetical protein